FNSTGFVDDHFKFEFDNTNICNTGLQRASELMLTNDLRSALIGRVISQELANISAHEMCREKELTDARERLELAKKIFGEFQSKLESVIGNVKAGQLAHADAEKEKDEKIKKHEKDLKDEKDRNLSLNKSITVKYKELGDLAAPRDYWEKEWEEKDKEI
ncbi:hypothetical protein A2U01_0011955, partial [Trifolium medium]|nr:hypothetical protein [Trifolium medium]